MKMQPLQARCALLAAELRLDRARPEAMRALIDAAVDEGFMSEHCLDALARGADLQAMQPAFADLLDAQGMALPGALPAMLTLLADRLGAIARGEAEERLEAMLAEVMDLRDQVAELAPNQCNCRDGQGLWSLLVLWDWLDDLRTMQQPEFDGQTGDAAWAALHERIRLAAGEWMRSRHGLPGWRALGLIP